MTEKEITEEDSKRIFWVIQTVFGFVLAKSIFDYKDALLNPLAPQNRLVVLGVLVAYFTALWSWIDYSYSSIVSPYHFRRSRLEPFRFVVDLFVVFLYAELIFTIGTIQKNPAADISATLTSFCLIFVFYFLSGLLRIVQYGRRASGVLLILVFIIVFFALAWGYRYISRHAILDGATLNLAALIATGLIMIAYRMIRAKLRRRTVWLAIDVDGVLANQIDALLPILKKKYDVSLKYNDITECDLAIGQKGLAGIIKEEQKNKQFILNMPPIAGASNGLRKLSEKYKIAVRTARDPTSDEWTQRWLKKHAMPFDVYENLEEGTKQDGQQDVSILIDDYIGNVQAFLAEGEGKAILFTQPWNRNRSELDGYLGDERLAFADSWSQVLEIVTKWGRPARSGALQHLISRWRQGRHSLARLSKASLE
jgi:5'(3')-deoxyribonucleotidase